MSQTFADPGTNPVGRHRARTGGRGGAGMAHETRSATGEGRSVRPPSTGDPDFEQVRRAVRGIRYGEVRVIIQDGVIVQIERLERQRLR